MVRLLMHSQLNEATMKIEYELNSMPAKDWKTYSQAYVEGVFRIYILDELYLEESGFLLAEFASVLKRWFKETQNDNNSDFVYESMDSDEAPILSFKNNGCGFIIKSVWERFECDVVLDKSRVLEKLNSFVEELSEQLESDLGISLS